MATTSRSKPRSSGPTQTNCSRVSSSAGTTVGSMLLMTCRARALPIRCRLADCVKRTCAAHYAPHNRQSQRSCLMSGRPVGKSSYDTRSPGRPHSAAKDRPHSAGAHTAAPSPAPGSARWGFPSGTRSRPTSDPQPRSTVAVRDSRRSREFGDSLSRFVLRTREETIREVAQMAFFVYGRDVANFNGGSDESEHRSVVVACTRSIRRNRRVDEPPSDPLRVRMRPKIELTRRASALGGSCCAGMRG